MDFIIKPKRHILQLIMEKYHLLQLISKTCTSYDSKKWKFHPRNKQTAVLTRKFNLSSVDTRSWPMLEASNEWTKV